MQTILDRDNDQFDRHRRKAVTIKGDLVIQTIIHFNTIVGYLKKGLQFAIYNRLEISLYRRYSKGQYFALM